MTRSIPSHLVPEFDPVAAPTAIVQAGGYRISVLTDRLLRIEFSPEGRFEDRPSQPFWFRRQPVPAFDAGEGGEGARDTWVETDSLRLTFASGAPPSPETLSVVLKAGSIRWRFGDPGTGNLLGTYRTLDTIDGSVPLENGLVSRDGWVVVDDSATLVFDKDGWLSPRGAPEDQLDLYFFGYGTDYKGALQDYRRIAGQVPVLPRWALGNWWSRYWEYDDAELRQLILDFERHDIPLSVCIIDMDWHITDTGNDSSGWTGYTWNRALFPDPEATLAFIHEHGLKTALNLHPAEGVHPHEEAYPAFARRLGLEPEDGEPIPFDLADPAFARAYFEILHHPEEARGVDFWWIDWQQGTLSGLPGLDPLWWLNHLHFFDLARPDAPAAGSGSPSGSGAGRRPFIFSRWGGLGNHRYPIGFSGDTYITWDSLAFQPYFTSTAANVGYGWWSHDIGGHYGGIRDAELYTRWVQYGVFSPILRLHSTKNAQLERRPFGWDAETLRLTRAALQLRHRLIPYIYTMSWRDHAAAETMVRPMYHDHPDVEAAYFCPDQYMFGTELIAAPHIRPRDPETGLARQVVWLPENAWHFFSGDRFSPGWHALYGDLDDVPLFARDGAIIPLCEPDDWQDPGALEIHIFPGASNTFDLFEDDGESTAYLDGQYRITRFDLDWSDTRLTFSFQPNASARTYTLVFRSLVDPGPVAGLLNGEPAPAAADYDQDRHTLTVSIPDLAEGDAFELHIDKPRMLEPGPEAMVGALRRIVSGFDLDNSARQVLSDDIPRITQEPERLSAYFAALAPAHTRAILEVLFGAGLHEVRHAGEPLLFIWNREGRSAIRYTLSSEHHRRWLSPERFQIERDRVPPFRGWRGGDLAESRWQAALRYGDLFTVTANGGRNWERQKRD